jgi:hypothetical protein
MAEIGSCDVGHLRTLAALKRDHKLS